MRLYEHMGVRICVADIISSSTAAMQPGPSGLQVMASTNAIANSAVNIPAEIVAEPFELRLASLNKMEYNGIQWNTMK